VPPRRVERALQVAAHHDLLHERRGVQRNEQQRDLGRAGGGGGEGDLAVAQRDQHAQQSRDRAGAAQRAEQLADQHVDQGQRCAERPRRAPIDDEPHGVGPGDDEHADGQPLDGEHEDQVLDDLVADDQRQHADDRDHHHHGQQHGPGGDAEVVERPHPGQDEGRPGLGGAIVGA